MEQRQTGELDVAHRIRALHRHLQHIGGFFLYLRRGCAAGAAGAAVALSVAHTGEVLIMVASRLARMTFFIVDS